jgi:lipoprotein-anchoring transpeptidase ErfK/SrfK
LARKLQIAVVFLIAVMLLAAVGAYAWDSSKSDEIAEGVTIGGVDVSGMTADEAKSAVRAELVEPLDKKVTVTYDDVEYRLSADKLEVDSDVDGMVDKALEESQEGGLPTRVWRYATGGEIDVAIAPQITYSNKAIDEFIAEVNEQVGTEPVNATIEPSAVSLEGVAGRDGIEVDTEALRTRIESVLQRTARRHVTVPVSKVEPDVTKEELAEQYPTYLTVNRSTFELTLWKDLEPAKTYTVAIGAAGFDTPAGVYNIQNKAVDPAWSVPNADWAGDLAGTVVPGGVPENPLKERWMGIFDGAGIHGTDDTGSLGTAASHGCVRMSIPDVIELYDKVPVGAPIYIA